MDHGDKYSVTIKYIYYRYNNHATTNGQDYLRPGTLPFLTGPGMDE